MVTITNTTVTRDDVWRAFRRTHDARLRERHHGILLRISPRHNYVNYLLTCSLLTL